MDLERLRKKISAVTSKPSNGPATLLGLWDEVKQKASDATDALRQEFIEGSVKVDKKARTFAISDQVLIPALLQIAKKKAPKAEVTIRPAPTGFEVSALVGGKRVTALLKLKSVTYLAGEVELVVGTPMGITLAERPVAQLFASLVARAFGGTWLGLKILSSSLPSELTWDGETAHLKTNLDAKGKVPPELMLLRATATVSRAGGWTTFTLDTLGSLALLWKFMGRALMELLFP